MEKLDWKLEKLAKTKVVEAFDECVKIIYTKSDEAKIDDPRCRFFFFGRVCNMLFGNIFKINIEHWSKQILSDRVTKD